MSSRVSKMRRSEVTKFCKACKDAGKSKAEVESHNSRNERGFVCCPTIKSHQCKKCSRYGHFETYCIVKNKTFINSDDFIIRSKSDEKPSFQMKTTQGMFSMLAIEDATVDDDNKVVTKKRNVSKRSWADWDSDDEDDVLHPNITLRAHQSSYRM